MPPRTRSRVTKVLKENIGVERKSKVKSKGKIPKIPRTALADKTNSLSDDNASIDVPVTTLKKTSSKDSKVNGNEVRPKRERRLPPRYIENQTLNSLSNSKDSLLKEDSVIHKQQKIGKELLPAKTSEHVKSTNKDVSNIGSTQVKQQAVQGVAKPAKTSKSNDKQVLITKYISNEEILPATRPKRNCRGEAVVDSKDRPNVSSLLQTPSQELESSLIANRPKRVHRLPSRFEDHSISPNKFIPVQPFNASTPLPQKIRKTVTNNSQPANIVEGKTSKTNKIDKSKPKPVSSGIKGSTSSSPTDKSSPDTNNNGNRNKRPKRVITKPKSPIKLINSKVEKFTPFAKRLLDKSLSFRVLEDRKSDEKGDVYEFTFDPNEEPTPQKKKRKRPAKKKPPKPKIIVWKSNYDDNVSKALVNLKSRIKPSQTKLAQNSEKPDNTIVPIHNEATENQVKPIENAPDKEQITQVVDTPLTNDNIPQNNNNAKIESALPVNDSATSIHASNYASIRVEDIAADFELSNHSDINYSPVNSPHQNTKTIETNETVNPARNDDHSVHNNDPLNLQDGASFFEDPPVASSSMNLSVRHPLASPWRVEFGALPMKWHNNTYLKANMTPAVECSFVNSEQANKKKHVYTNMLTEEQLPEIFENPPALKQTSIISFIKEVAEKNANKKKRRRSPSPIKSNPIIQDTNTASHKTPKKAKIAKDSTPSKSNSSNNSSKDRENPTHSSIKSLTPENAQKNKDKDCTYFGFDDSETNQENHPVKNNPSSKPRNLRSRKVLQEFNIQPIPTRAAMPANPKTKLTSSEVVEQLFYRLKSAEEAQLPTKDNEKEPNNAVETNIEKAGEEEWYNDDDSNSVHLFEDIEVVHHLKLHRKSYGKAKKVGFQQTEDSDSDQPPVTAGPEHSSDEDDLADLTFQEPDIKQKKPRKKKKPKKMLTKKEEKEVEQWAAGFNSMCEDIDEFPLLVE